MTVELKIDGAIATIQLNRPEKRNALTDDMRAELQAHCRTVRFDDSVRAVMLTGAGDAFCAGADVARMAANDLKGTRTRLQKIIHPLIQELYHIEKPVIAAVRGPAAGIGWSLALACDVIIASKTARFLAAFTKVGLAPDGGAAWFLTQRVGQARAMELVYSARSVAAAEASSLGLVDIVVEDDELSRASLKLAAQYAGGPTYAFGMAKAMFSAASSTTLDQFLLVEADLQPQVVQSADHQEGILAFGEKRSPLFKGR